MKSILIFTTICFFLCSSVFGSAEEEHSDLNLELTNTIRLNWPYKAFLAIPRISEINPMVTVEIVEDGKIDDSIICIEVNYFEIQKKFEPKLVLERDSLHRLLCKAMVKAIIKTKDLSFDGYFLPGDQVGLRFNFSLGEVKVGEIPFPPIDPVILLEDLFVDETENVNFGKLDIPVEEDSEIKETQL